MVRKIGDLVNINPYAQITGKIIKKVNHDLFDYKVKL